MHTFRQAIEPGDEFTVRLRPLRAVQAATAGMNS